MIRTLTIESYRSPRQVIMPLAALNLVRVLAVLAYLGS